jgi:ABC-type transport system involved in Fe-S cluster assembly fused permease/ATPase subunit
MNFGQSNSLMNPINLGQNNVMGLTQNPMSFGQSMTMNMNQHNLMNMGQSMSMNPNTGISQNASMMQNIGGNIYPELKQWSGH